MDFKGFTKVADNKTHTLFKHDNGSTLKVAKSGLSEKMRRQMDKIPIRLKDGGDPSDIPASLRAPSDDSSSPINININPGSPDIGGVAQVTGQSPDAMPKSSDNTYTDAEGGVHDPSKDQPGLLQGLWDDNAEAVKQWFNPKIDAQGNPVQDQAAIPSTPAGQVASNDPGLTGAQPAPGAPAPMQPTTPEQHAQAVSQQLRQEDQHIAHDFAQGHMDKINVPDPDTGKIVPLTPADLFAKKDTLGKIGTIFGMLLSGAGSGLARQPNMLMEMMNKQIQNDLEAQKTNVTNKQNWLRLNLDQQRTSAEVRNMDSEAKMRAYTLANMQMNRAALHKLTQDVNKMPIGSPQRAQAEQTLAMMNQGVQNENFALADRAAAASAYIKFAMGNADQNQEDPAVQVRRRQLVGAINPEQSKEALKEIGQTKNHVQLNQNALDSFDTVAKLATVKSHIMNPIQSDKRIDAEWNPMMDKLTKDTEGRVTPITVDMMASLKPKVTDNADTLALKRQKLSAILNAGFATPTLDSLGVRANKGEYSEAPRGTQQATHDEIRYDQQGNAYRRGPDGRAVRINQTAGR